MQASAFPLSRPKAYSKATYTSIFLLVFGILSVFEPRTSNAQVTSNAGIESSIVSMAALPDSAAYYASPSGRATGDGSINNPWDLQTALDQPSSVQGGDTIWLRGGTYRGAFVSSLSGSLSSPIIVKQYPGERATIDSYGGQGVTLVVNGHDTWYEDFEITNSRVNISPSSGDEGLSVFGARTRFIHLVIHDHYNCGAGWWTEATDSEFYGNLIYYNGRPDHYAHGLYAQNNTGTKTVRDNLLLSNGAYGLHIYGENTPGLNNFVIDGNNISNGGAVGPPGYNSNFLLGGAAPSTNISFTNNVLWDPVRDHTNALFGFEGLSNASDIRIVSNLFMGGGPALTMDHVMPPVQVQQNTVYGNWIVPMYFPPSGGGSGYNWNNNTYYHDGADPVDPFYISAGTVPFATWRAQTGFDQNSTYTHQSPTGIYVSVRPDRYEAGRGTISILDYAGTSPVGVDLSSILGVGQRYEIRNAQDFYAPPVVSGTYSGGSVSIPVTGLTMAQPVGMAPPPYTGPYFNAFIVIPASSYETPTPFPTPSPTATRVPSVTRTPTNTRVPSLTRTPTTTGVPAVTATPTNTVFPGLTNTPTSTGVANLTNTPTSTAGGTPMPTATPGGCATTFSDVLPTDYFYAAVNYLYCQGVISGYSDNTFRPYNNTTRGQLSKIVVLAEGWPIDTTGGPHFSDVGPDNAFYDYVETAYSHQVISGYADGTFRWGNNVTRAQLSKIVVEAEGWPIDTTGGPHFNDVPPTNPFYSFVETAYNKTVISGYSDGSFRPGISATRGQISKIIYKAVFGR